MSRVIDIESEMFEALIQEHTLVFLDFWAPWCAPCQTFKNTYEHMAGMYPQICFAQINIERSPSLSDTLEIRSIPFLMIIKNEVVIFAESGNMPLARLQELAEQALQTTM